jgi:uncharacterized protein GlcG (DUF336 family)
MIGLERANRIVDATLAEARRLQLAPLAVVVLDPGGNLVVAKREDGTGILRIDIAHAKAWGSLGMGFGSRELAERAKTSAAFVSVLAAVSAGRITPSPGGVLIADHAGSVLGAIGVSGDKGDHDETVAVLGIESVGLRAYRGLPD